MRARVPNASHTRPLPSAPRRAPRRAARLLRRVQRGHAQRVRQQAQRQRGQMVRRQQLHRPERRAHRRGVAAAWHRLQQAQHGRPARAQRLAWRGGATGVLEM